MENKKTVLAVPNPGVYVVHENEREAFINKKMDLKINEEIKKNAEKVRKLKK